MEKKLKFGKAERLKWVLVWSVATLLVEAALAGSETVMVGSDGVLASPGNFVEANDLALKSVVDSDNAVQNVAISNITSLVGTGVAGVESNLQAHVVAADAKNAEQDASIADAAVQTEVDPIWSAVSNDYYLASNPDGFISSFTETDPIWSAVSNDYTLTADVNATNEAQDTVIDGKIAKSGTYSAWTDVGGTYTSEQVIATSPLLSNGVADVTFDFESNYLTAYAQISTNGTDWEQYNYNSGLLYPFHYYIQIVVTNALPPVGLSSLTISNIVAWSWNDTSLISKTNDTIGQVLLVDDPLVDRAIVNKQTLDRSVASVTPAGWALYNAATNVNLAGHELILGDSWKMQALSDNSMLINHAGLPAITLVDDAVGLHIDSFDLVSNVVYMSVATNLVVSEPYPQYSSSLVNPDWQTITSYTGSYPVVTNNSYTLSFASQAPSGFYRVIQADGIVVTIAGDLVANSVTASDGVYTGLLATLDYVKSQLSTNNTPTAFSPRNIGDELIIHTSTNVIYKAFGTTTNDWDQIWP